MPHQSLQVNKHRTTLPTCLLLFSLLFLAGCGGGSPSIPTVPAAPATATSPPPTATSAPAAATSAPATATRAPGATPTPAGEQVTFRFVATLSTVEEMDDIELLLHNIEGILAVAGNENNITITYDPGLITEDELRQHLERIGYPVQPPEGMEHDLERG